LKWSPTDRADLGGALWVIAHWEVENEATPKMHKFFALCIRQLNLPPSVVVPSAR
jgi:hypothetical protein